MLHSATLQVEQFAAMLLNINSFQNLHILLKGFVMFECHGILLEHMVTSIL